MYLGILADLNEVQAFFFEVIAQTHKVKIAGHQYQTMRHRSTFILRQNLVNKMIKTLVKRGLDRSNFNTMK